MKKYTKIFFLIVPLLTNGCANSASEKLDMESILKNRYEKSNFQLNKSYEKINKYSPEIIKNNIENNKINWLEHRSKYCGDLNLDYKNNARSIECFIEENNKRILEIEDNYKSIKDITNNSLISLDVDSNNKYYLDFQTYCLCDVSIPYIDTKKNKIILHNSCESNESSQIVEDKITNVKFDEIGRLEVTAINSYGSKYKVAFENRVGDIYTIVIEGEWGSIKDINLPEFVSPENNSNIAKENICGDFNG